MLADYGFWRGLVVCLLALVLPLATTADVGPAMLVRNINAGDQGSRPFAITAVDDTVFFAAADRIHGQELWRSDGTGAGTRRVLDIDPEARGSVGGLLAVGADGAHGKQLWRTDGTPGGTSMMRDIVPGEK